MDSHYPRGARPLPTREFPLLVVYPQQTFGKCGCHVCCPATLPPHLWTTLQNREFFRWVIPLNSNCTFDKWHIPHPAPLQYSPQVIKFSSLKHNSVLTFMITNGLYIYRMKAFSVYIVWFVKGRRLYPHVGTVHTAYCTRKLPIRNRLRLTSSRSFLVEGNLMKAFNLAERVL